MTMIIDITKDQSSLFFELEKFNRCTPDIDLKFTKEPHLYFTSDVPDMLAKVIIENGAVSLLFIINETCNLPEKTELQNIRNQYDEAIYKYMCYIFDGESEKLASFIRDYNSDLILSEEWITGKIDNIKMLMEKKEL